MAKLTRGREKLPPEVLQKIKETVNILEVVGEHVVLRKSGSNYVGLCPFHSERTPSFSVSERKQLYHCYGCKKGGDLITFVMEILGISFPEAIEELSERAHLALPRNWHESPEDPEEDTKRKEEREKTALAYKLNRFSAAFFHHTLGNSSSALTYYRLRGVRDEQLKSFYLGSATDSWDGLASHLSSKKAPLNLAADLGLIRPSTRNAPQRSGPGYFDLFRNRAIFPILNLRGKVAGFGGRTLGDESPKYLNSPDSSIFQKSKLIFGLYQAQKHIREKDEVILVEGYFDVLAMHAAGFTHVVAACGTSLTPDHLVMLKRLASRIIVLFDGDAAGVSATQRAMEIGLERGLILYSARIPDGLDPDEILIDPAEGAVKADGQERMVAILKEAKPILDARMEEAVQSAQNSSEGRTQALKTMGGWLARYQDPVGREIRVQWLQKQWGISRHLIHEAMGKLPQVSPVSGPMRNEKPNPPVMRSTQKRVTPMDRILLTGLTLGEEYTRLLLEARTALPPKRDLGDLFDYPPAGDLMTLILSEPQWIERLRMAPEGLLEASLDDQIRSILTEALVSTGTSLDLKNFQGAISKRVARNWARFSQQIKAAIADAEAKKNAELQVQLLKDYLDVQRKMKEFSSFYDEE